MVPANADFSRPSDGAAFAADRLPCDVPTNAARVPRRRRLALFFAGSAVAPATLVTLPVVTISILTLVAWLNLPDNGLVLSGQVLAALFTCCSVCLVMPGRRGDRLAGPAPSRYRVCIAGAGSDLQPGPFGGAEFNLSYRVTDLRHWWEGWPHRAESDRAADDAFSVPHGAASPEGIARRIFDIGLSIVLLVVSLPVVAMVALLIKLDSRGPVFYRQERVGLGGKCFQLVKFRSMRADAEANSGPQWAVEADPRVTRVGAILRATRIDELPQIWNVLRGEMSLIGPRPERPYFVSQLAASLPHYNDRSIVKPGITGWAQVNYRYGASIEDARIKLAYDLYYIRHRSILLDLRILAATVRVVLLRQGAR